MKPELNIGSSTLHSALLQHLGLSHSELISAAGVQPFQLSETWIDRACEASGQPRRKLWQHLARTTESVGALENVGHCQNIWTMLGLSPGESVLREVEKCLAMRKNVVPPGQVAELPAGPAEVLGTWRRFQHVITTTRAAHRAKAFLDWNDAIRIAAVVDVVCVRALAHLNGDELPLLSGMIYRSMRIDYDLLVSSGRKTAAEWVRLTSRRLGLNDESWVCAVIEKPPPAGLELAALLASRHAIANPGDYLLDPMPLLPNDLLAPAHDPLSLDARTDIPSKAPALDLAIARVGTSRVEIPVSYLDDITGRVTVATCEIEVTVRLPPDMRGVHMSRFQEAAMRLAEAEWKDLGQATDALADEACSGQMATEAQVKLRSRIFFRKLTDQTRRRTMMPARLVHTCHCHETGRTRGFYLTLGVMTACPCTLAFSKLKTARTLSSALGTLPELVHSHLPPTFTHSQPGTVRVGVRSTGDLPLVTDVFEAIASSAHLVESVLKRPDEHSLVERTHSRPQFCEDVARGVGVAVAALCASNDEISVVVELDESIHPHRALAELRGCAGDLWQGHIGQ